jgi:hypothetical protein
MSLWLKSNSWLHKTLHGRKMTFGYATLRLILTS